VVVVAVSVGRVVLIDLMKRKMCL